MIYYIKLQELYFCSLTLGLCLNHSNEEYYHPSRYRPQNRFFSTQIKKVQIKKSEI